MTDAGAGTEPVNSGSTGNFAGGSNYGGDDEKKKKSRKFLIIIPILLLLLGGTGIASIFIFGSGTSVLSVTIVDLPSGISGYVQVHEPNGSVKTLTKSQVLTLNAGNYTVTASYVHVKAGSYTLSDSVKPVLLPGDTFSPLIGSSTVVLPAGKTVNYTADYYNVIPDTTKFLPNSIIQSVAGSVGSNQTVVINGNPQTPGLVKSPQVGNILLAGVGKLTPQGLLGQVSSVTPEGSKYIISTVPTTLEAAFPRLELNANTQLTNSPIELNASQQGAPGTNLVGLKSLFERVKEFCKTTGSLYANGSMSISPSMSFHTRWGGWFNLTLKEMRISLTLGETTTFNIGATGKVSCSKDDIPITPRITLGSITFVIGFVPVVVVPTVQFLASISGAATGQTGATATQKASVTVGAAYVEGDFYTFGNKSFSISGGAQNCVSLTGNATVGPRISLLLYGLAGVNFNLDATASATIAPLNTPWWTIDVGGRAGAGIEAFGEAKTWPGIISFDKAIYSGKSKVPGNISIAGPNMIQGQLGSNITAQFSATGDQVTPPLEWTVISGSLPPGLTLNSNGYVTGTPTVPGSYTVTIQVQDNAISKYVCNNKPRTATSQVTFDISGSSTGGGTTPSLPPPPKGY